MLATLKFIFSSIYFVLVLISYNLASQCKIYGEPWWVEFGKALLGPFAMHGWDVKGDNHLGADCFSRKVIEVGENPIIHLFWYVMAISFLLSSLISFFSKKSE